MRSLILAMISVIAASPALALSCKAPNFGEDFNRIARAVELYSVAYGTLRLAGTLQSYTRGEPREVLFEFNGTYLGQGATKRVAEVVVRTECVSAWCGQIPPEETPMLMFLQHERNGLSLLSGPCASDFFIAPSLGKVGAIRACLRMGRCGDAEKAAFDLNR